MKIAVMISTFTQVSQNQYRDLNYTKIFDSSSSIDEMLVWARTIIPKAYFHDLILSEVVEDDTNKDNPS